MKHPTQDEIIAHNRAESHRKRQYQDSMRMTVIGWIGIIITTIIMLLVTCQPATAQTMYEVEYENQADLLVYKVKYPSQADIRYYVVEYRSQADESKNHWYYVRYPSQAQYTIYWVKYPSQADSLVYEVEYPSQTK